MVPGVEVWLVALGIGDFFSVVQGVGVAALWVALVEVWLVLLEVEVH